MNWCWLLERSSTLVAVFLLGLMAGAAGAVYFAVESVDSYLEQHGCPPTTSEGDRP